MKPRWKHYIENENRIVIGTSFTWDLKHNTVSNMEYPIKLTFNMSKLEENNKHFLINSNRVHLQTMAYKYEDETPNELFVEGTIKPLSKYLINIEVINPISKETEQYIIKFNQSN